MIVIHDSNTVDAQKIVKDINGNCLDEYSSIATETCLISLNPKTCFDCIKIALSQGKPNYMYDQFCEELGFPSFFNWQVWI